MSGAHGELTGVMIMAAYHKDRGNEKDHIIIPDSAHGTNPASARLAGYNVVTIPSDDKGMMDFDLFKAALNEKTAGVMLTCPNTLGVFNTRIKEICDAVHEVDGLMYYDGANFNAIMGRYRPGDMGFDVCHLNLHKSFATPHGGGGPGVVGKLRPYLPISRVVKTNDGIYSLNYDEPKSIGYIAPFYGNFGIVARAYAYLLCLGRDGMLGTSNRAVLNANYLQEKLRPLFGEEYKGRCMHEFVFSGKCLAKYGIHTLDLAKGMIDRGIHPPTIYFPLNVPEAFMVEPTETEDRDTLDYFVRVVEELFEVAKTDPDKLHEAPVSTPVSRLDEVKAAREMRLVADR
jgi:glycine dehydrogenase subunit 2